ncbi:MAG: hypothetical protein GXO25_02950 [Euryarchaeota archaeon]|nr:hypothetical protein [Euryarchaeota archaeon]
MAKNDLSELYVYGSALIARALSIKYLYGDEGLQSVVREMVKRGYDGPLDLEHIKSQRKYPFEYSHLSLEVYRDLFGEEKMLSMARKAFHIMETLGKHVHIPKNPEYLFKNANVLWSSLYAFGYITGEMTGEKEGYLRGKDVCVTPLFCKYITYRFLGMMESINVTNPQIEHTKCQLKGDEISEWYIVWQ